MDRTGREHTFVTLRGGKGQFRLRQAIPHRTKLLDARPYRPSHNLGNLPRRARPTRRKMRMRINNPR
ncbi:hypothetical protein GCM10025785_00540 [Corynebacterium canis]